MDTRRLSCYQSGDLLLSFVLLTFFVLSKQDVEFGVVRLCILHEISGGKYSKEIQKEMGDKIRSKSSE